MSAGREDLFAYLGERKGAGGQSLAQQCPDTVKYVLFYCYQLRQKRLSVDPSRDITGESTTFSLTGEQQLESLRALSGDTLSP